VRVQFAYNQEELVDASLRFSARSKAVRAIWRKRTAWAAFLAGVLVFAIFGFSLKGAIAGVLAVLLTVIIDPLTYQYQWRRNLRKIVKERYGEQNQFLCEVELIPEGLMTKSENIQSNTEWEAIDEVVPTSDSVDIFGRKGGVIVRNRAFSSSEERQQFIELAREYTNRAKAIRET
jgi:YcxB-like protein